MKRDYKNVNFIEMEEALIYPFLTTKEIRVLLRNCSESKLSKNLKDIIAFFEKKKDEANLIEEPNEQNKMKAKYFYEIDCRPYRFSKLGILEVLHVDENYIKSQAKKLREMQK